MGVLTSIAARLAPSLDAAGYQMLHQNVVRAGMFEGDIIAIIHRRECPRLEGYLWLCVQSGSFDGWGAGGKRVEHSEHDRALRRRNN